MRYKILKILLFFLVSFTALTSALSGLLMIINPNGEILNLPLKLLEGTPFKNFMIPGILLLIIVGGINLLAAFFYVRNHPKRYNWTMAGGVIISGWIISQMIIIHAVHWMHILYLTIGISVILLSYQFKGKWAV